MRLAASALAFGLAFALSGASARAELFRCTGPDGKTIFTDQKQNCPGAEPSEPTGVVHRVETPESRHSAPDSETAAPAASEERITSSSLFSKPSSVRFRPPSWSSSYGSAPAT